MTVGFGRPHDGGHEIQGKQTEDKRLDDASEKGNQDKRHGDQVGHQKSDHHDHHFTGEDVAKKTTGKRHHLGDIADHFQKPQKNFQKGVGNVFYFSNT